MATSMASFVGTLQGLVIDGVKRVFLAPPASVSTGDLPALWLNSVGVNEAPAAKGRSVFWPTLRAELLLAITPTAQGRPEDSFAEAVQWADTLKVALREAELGIGITTVDVSVVTLAINEKSYWGVRANVEAKG